MVLRSNPLGYQLSWVFLCFPQFLHANAGIIDDTSPLTNLLQFISHPTVRHYIFYIAKPSLNNPQPSPLPPPFSVYAPLISDNGLGFLELRIVPDNDRQKQLESRTLLLRAYVLAICDVPTNAAIVFSQVEHKHVVRQQSGLSVVAVDKETGFPVI
jgi:hypothetical protein